MGKTSQSKETYSIDQSIEHFLKLIVTRRVIKEKQLNERNITELKKFFELFPYSKCHDQIFMNLAYFVYYDLDGFYNRIQDLRKVKKNSREWHRIQMGEEGDIIFTKKYLDNPNYKSKYPNTRSSKAALAFFRYIDQTLLDHNIKVRALYEDKETNNHEFRIRDDKLAWFCYDYTIKELGLIIEYHGEHCHPKEEDAEWTHLFTNETSAEVYAKDQYKKSVAENKGYEYHVVWHNESINSKNQKLSAIFNNYDIQIPTVYPKHYRTFSLIKPDGKEEIITNLSNITKLYGLSEYRISQLKEGKIQSYGGYQIRKIS